MNTKLFSLGLLLMVAGCASREYLVMKPVPVVVLGQQVTAQVPCLVTEAEAKQYAVLQMQQQVLSALSHPAVPPPAVLPAPAPMTSTVAASSTVHG